MSLSGRRGPRAERGCSARSRLVHERSVLELVSLELLARDLLNQLLGGAAVRKESAILVIDDEPLSRAAIARWLGSAGFKIVQAASGEDGLWAIDQHQFSCVVTDFRLPDLDAHAFVRKCHRIAPTLPVVVMSAPEDGQDAAQCLHEGASELLPKPFSSSNICVIVRQAIEKSASRLRPCVAAASARSS
jgi:DNA-binding NtrC family response regulator